MSADLHALRNLALLILGAGVFIFVLGFAVSLYVSASADRHTRGDMDGDR